MQRDTTALDRAVIAYRENPTEENRARLLAAQSEHVRTFHESQTQDYLRRTK